MKAGYDSEGNRASVNICTSRPKFETRKRVSFIDLFPDGSALRPACRPLDLSAFKINHTYVLARDDSDILSSIRLVFNQHDSCGDDDEREASSENLLRDESSEYFLEYDGNGKIVYRSHKDGKEVKFECGYPCVPAVVGLWEDELVWDEDDRDKALHSILPSSDDLITSRNTSLDNGSWEQCIYWEEQSRDDYADASKAQEATKRVFSTEDLIEDMEKHKRIRISTSSFKKFNISQDRLYERVKTTALDRTRQSYGNISLKHALPAIKLHTQYYKPQLTARELRRFHRPLIKFPVGEDISFSRLRSGTGKIKSNIESSEIYKSARQLSLRDNSDFVLFEYSEEYPMMLSNFGMGCILYNYYRKKDDNDESFQEHKLGVPFVLESVDASPFLGFGDVSPGCSIQAISNIMYKAPVFPQPVDPNHFLLIRYSFRSKTKYYIRNIPYLFTVGQIFPLKEVPPPQSRRITQTIKGRMQVAAFRLIKKDPEGLLLYEKFAKIFHGWSELHLKQRLKEFAQFAKKGDNTGWWKLKPGVKIPSEEEMRKIVTPEMVCLCQSMLAGQQLLKDTGYGDTDEIDDDDSGDFEPKLAPWHLSKNFVQASQNKSMIKVYGEGDPTGRGEALSLLRASMKEPFLRAGESELDRIESSKMRLKSYHRFSFAEQQQVYREEIFRVWNSQLRALSSTSRPVDDDRDEPSSEVSENTNQDNSQKERNTGENAPKNSTSESFSPKDFCGKRLIIKRLYRDVDGNERTASEVITNMSLINAYLRKRAIIEKLEQSSRGNTPLDQEEIKARKRKLVQSHIDQMKEKQTMRGYKKRKASPKTSADRSVL